MTIKIEEATRKQVAVFVPQAIRKAIDSYYGFMDSKIETEAKKFAEHHSAGKVALAHIELLIKLARWADVETGVDRTALAFIASGREEANGSESHKVHRDFEETAGSGE
jgi:hypothetical protein